MIAVFVICAALGSTILVCQFVMTLVGLGGHAFSDADMPTDIGHGFGGDFHGGADGLHGDAGFHTDHAGGDSDSGDSGGGDAGDGDSAGPIRPSTTAPRGCSA